MDGSLIEFPHPVSDELQVMSNSNSALDCASHSGELREFAPFKLQHKLFFGMPQSGPLSPKNGLKPSNGVAFNGVSVLEGVRLKTTWKIFKMAALGYLRRAGLAVELEGDRLRVSPAERITDAIRQFVRTHRAELLAQMIAADDLQSASKPSLATAVSAPIPTPVPAVESAPEAVSEPRRAA